jgi:hypothetical protein
MMRSGAGGVGGVAAGAGGLIRFSSFSLARFSLSLPLSMLCRSLAVNRLTGTIPSQLAELTRLTSL